MLIKSLVILIISSITLSAQWNWIHPTPQGNNLNTIKAIDAENYISVGDLGTILISSNSGNNWEKINTEIDYNLNSIFVGDQNIWVCGDNGIIINSSDKGNTWLKQESNTELNLNSIFFLDNINGFCAGGYWKNGGVKRSVLLKTSDGGNSWSEIPLSKNSPINKITFINNTHGFICGGIPGSNGFINTAVFLKTTDGGISWESQSFNFTNFTSVSFVNENVGYLTLESGYYMKTTDGGINWNVKAMPGDITYLNNLLCVDENNIWIVGGGWGWGGRIYHTTNGGDDWQTKIMWGSGHYTAFYDIEHINSDISFIVGIDGAIIKTIDGGQNWNSLNKRYFSDKFSGFFLNSNQGWASTTTKIFHTTNGGASWTNIPNNANIGNLRFIDENIMYGISGKTVCITSDGGQNWNINTLSYSNRQMSLKSIYHWNEMHGIALGESMEPQMGSQSNFVAITVDGWSSYSIKLITGYQVINVTAFSEFVWGIIQNRDIIRSTDFGESWEKINTTFSGNFAKIYALDNENIWILGNDIVIKSSDNGINWEKLILPAGYSYQDLCYKDNNNLWLLVSNDSRSEVLYTSDGGANWEQLGYKLPGYFKSISITNDDYLFAFADNGTILATNNLPNVVNYPDNQYVEKFHLEQNYPNPFNSATTISYSLPQNGFVKLQIFDMLGSEIIELVNKEQSMGNYKIEFNAQNLASGIYFYRLKCDNFIETKKLILLK